MGSEFPHGNGDFQGEEVLEVTACAYIHDMVGECGDYMYTV